MTFKKHVVHSNATYFSTFCVMMSIFSLGMMSLPYVNQKHSGLRLMKGLLSFTKGAADVTR